MFGVFYKVSEPITNRICARATVFFWTVMRLFSVSPGPDCRRAAWSNVAEAHGGEA